MGNYSISESYRVVSRDSGGSQNKYHMDGIWYKQDTEGEESVAESIISLLLKHSNIKNYVNYDACYVNGKRSCRATAFLKKDETFISLHKLYMAAYHKILSDDAFKINGVHDRFDFLVSAFKDAIRIDLTGYISNILALDMLILNPDRHFKNMGVIYNGYEYREAPIFDNGQSLGANWNLCPPFLSVEECLENIHSCTIAGSFEMQFEAVKEYDTLKIEYDSFMLDLSNMQLDSRTVEILKYQLKRYEKIFNAKGDNKLCI